MKTIGPKYLRAAFDKNWVGLRVGKLRVQFSLSRTGWPFELGCVLTVHRDKSSWALIHIGFRNISVTWEVVP